jgi:hypothetical protein
MATRGELVLKANGTETTGRYLTDLVYELLDAHSDTMRLARDLADDREWAVHLEYLRRLQRVGRVALARLDEA